MVEVIVPFVIDKLTSLVSPYIVEEIKLQKGVSKELTFIKNELQIITAFLRDAENRAERSDAVKEWVKQVRNLAYRIENTIDEHVMLTHMRRENKMSSIVQCLSCACIPEFKQRHDIASLIADVKAEISEIQQRRIAYDLQVIDAEKDVWYDPRAGFLYPKDSDLVGLEDPKSDIFKLLNLEVKDSRCSVIAMVGMAGIGKTTLAWKVYNDFEVKKNFYVRAWVNVTQSYIRKDVFQSMLQGFYKSAMQPNPQVPQMDEEMVIIEELRGFLHDKRYLVVFDDVWDLMLWNHVKNALPDSKGSKIVLTTRQETIALTWKETWIENNIYNPKLLSPEKSLELFYKKALQGEECPQWLQEISKSIVNKCEGLPLALVTLGALLSTRAKVFAEWKRFYDSLGSELEQNPQLSNNISKILLLSYKGLPHFLKPCLLYFALFPESSFIESNRLIKLWIAEDFIKAKRGVSIEDVAKEYLIELVQRNLVQVSARYDCGRIKNVRVHDLIYEVLHHKRDELNFCQVLTREEVNEVDVQSRRLSIQKGGLDDALKSISSKYDRFGARTFLLFGAQELTSIALLSSSLLKKIYLLKVLDLQGAVLDQIPKEMGDISLLQYLSLRYTKVKTIPKTIGKLKNLLTLDLKRCPIRELPAEVGNLRKLRHLVVYQNTWNNTSKRWEIGPVKILGEAIKHLKNLQKLADVNVATSVGFLDQLGKFTMLKYLAISNVKHDNSWNLCKAIEKLVCLESLNISVDYESVDPLDLQHVTSPPIQLQRLYLIGPLHTFPNWIGELENLNKLRFRGSKLVDIPLNILQNLPNLTMLGINEGVYYGERLVFQVGGFQKLKSMYFDALLNLNSFEIELGALPLLEDLLIHRSPKLKEVPIGLQHLKKLASLKLVEMPDEFVTGISSLPSIVHSVADIRVGYQTPSGIYIYNKL